MSWITNIDARPDPNFKDDGPKVPDPAIPNRMVSTKSANQPFLKCVLSFTHTLHLFLTRKPPPFLRYKAYRDEQAKLHAAWRAREDERLAAIARGDPNPPPAEADPTAQREIGLLGLLKFLIYLFIGILLAGKFVTGEWDWGLEGAASLRRLWPTQQRLFSESHLARFDGRVEGQPIYLAVRVFPFSFFGGLRVVHAGVM